MPPMKIALQRLSVKEQLLVAAAAGLASITSLFALVLAPMALAA